MSEALKQVDQVIKERNELRQRVEELESDIRREPWFTYTPMFKELVIQSLVNMANGHHASEEGAFAMGLKALAQSHGGAAGAYVEALRALGVEFDLSSPSRGASPPKPWRECLEEVAEISREATKRQIALLESTLVGMDPNAEETSALIDMVAALRAAQADLDSAGEEITRSQGEQG